MNPCIVQVGIQTQTGRSSMNPSDPRPFVTPMAASSIENTHYFCVAKGNRILHSHSSTGDRELEALAALCLDCAPPFHSLYSHTEGDRTFGFLIDDDGYTFFAIADRSLGSPGTLRVLERVRHGFKKALRNGVHDELVPVLRSLMTSLEGLSRPSAAEESSEQSGSSDGLGSTEAPLLGRSGSNRSDWKGVKDRQVVAEPRDVGEDRARAVRIDMPSEPARALPLQKSSSSKTRGQQTGRRLWWRHVKIVIAVDALLCLVLFGVWMVVCRGFQCVSSR